MCSITRGCILHLAPAVAAARLTASPLTRYSQRRHLTIGLPAIANCAGASRLRRDAKAICLRSSSAEAEQPSVDDDRACHAYTTGRTVDLAIIWISAWLRESEGECIPRIDDAGIERPAVRSDCVLLCAVDAPGKSVAGDELYLCRNEQLILDRDGGRVLSKGGGRQYEGECHGTDGKKALYCVHGTPKTSIPGWAESA